MQDKNRNEDQVRMPLPKREKNQMFAVVNRRLGGSRMNVACEDGKTRIARIPGGKKRSIKKIHNGDLVIIAPWDIQDEKADIQYKYRRSQAKILSKKGILPDELKVF
ncbi:MAG: translation initiation factor eIF-1A [Candidatus Thermoplasmatota archaeon]